MADADNVPADRSKIAFARWDKRMRESLRPLLTRKIIAEHKRDPVGIHSDALDRALNYFRRPNMLDHYVMVHAAVQTMAGCANDRRSRAGSGLRRRARL